MPLAQILPSLAAIDRCSGCEARGFPRSSRLSGQNSASWYGHCLSSPACWFKPALGLVGISRIGTERCLMNAMAQLSWELGDLADESLADNHGIELPPFDLQLLLANRIIDESWRQRKAHW